LIIILLLFIDDYLNFIAFNSYLLNEDGSIDKRLNFKIIE